MTAEREDNRGPSNDDVRFVVTLAYPPVWYAPDGYWSTRAYNDFTARDAYASKPHHLVDAALTDSLRDVINRAAEGLGVVPGPTNHAANMSEFVARMAFYEASDDDEFDIQRMYQSPRELPVVFEDGTVQLKSWRDVAVLELLVSSNFGLIQGDPLRPYVCASLPQGSLSSDVVLEGLRFTADAVQGAIRLISASKEGLHSADEYVGSHPIESAVGAATASGVGKRLSRRTKKRRKGSAEQ